MARREMRNIATLTESAAEDEHAALWGGPSFLDTGTIHSRPSQDKGKRREESVDGNEQDEVEEEIASDRDKNGERKFVYHHEIFDRLVAVARDNGAYHYVNEEPAHGPDPRDVTAYRASQRTWAKVLAHRPANLSLWQTPQSLNESIGHNRWLRFNGQIVVDYTRRPIRVFDIPWAISSAVEGWRVEAWLRSDRRMKMSDIVARVYTKPKGRKRAPVYHERSLSTRAKRFREEAGLVCWGTQHAKPEAIAYFQSLRSDAQIRHNLAVQRDLTTAERSNYTLITMGRNVSQEGVGTANQADRERCMRRHQRNAREDYPEGEFQPGARDGGDLFDDLIGGSVDESKGAMDVLSGNDVARPSVPASSPRGIPSFGRNATMRDSGPMATEPIAFGGIEEAQHWDDHPNVESWQDSPFTDAAAPSYVHRQTAEDYHDALSEASLYSQLEDFTDSRNDEPTTVEEVQMLQSALGQTIADFHELSGGSIPDQTNPAENYLSQWAALQTQFNLVWRGLWNNDNAPTLRGLDRWVGGIANWQTAGLARSDRDIADEEAWAMYFEE